MSKARRSEIADASMEAEGRAPRGSRRRPDLPPPKVEQIRPRSGMSRAEVAAHQRRRLLDGLAAALAYHGYEDTKITDIVELAGVSRPTFYEYFESKEECFAAAYADGCARLTARISAAAEAVGPTEALASGLAAGLDFLAEEPTLAHLLFVESLAAARPARHAHEGMLDKLADALRQVLAGPGGRNPLPPGTARLLAGGLTSYVSGRILAGEAGGLPASRDLLLGYLFAAGSGGSRSLAAHAAGS
ncbi:MAG TPA: TetR/AcrR family transcriptional regulator [Chloroflexota bacterium]|nr:TetR/AcrR family transcriptional regulator [Chloroflexota bacterium]